MDKADIRIITGDQGAGKSNTGTGYAIDDYMAHAVAVSPDGNKQYPLVGFFPYYTCKIDGEERRVPEGYSIVSPIKIFANYHLHGVKFVYTTLTRIIEYLNSDAITEGWMLIDESYMTDARNSMTNVGKIIAMFGSSIRKRKLHFVLMVQFESQLEKRYRAYCTTRVLCEYNERTKIITLDIKEKGQRKKTVSYLGKQYWRFYKTDEIIQIPEGKIARALEAAR